MLGLLVRFLLSLSVVTRTGTAVSLRSAVSQQPAQHQHQYRDRIFDPSSGAWIPLLSDPPPFPEDPELRLVEYLRVRVPVPSSFTPEQRDTKTPEETLQLWELAKSFTGGKKFNQLAFKAVLTLPEFLGGTPEVVLASKILGALVGPGAGGFLQRFQKIVVENRFGWGGVPLLELEDESGDAWSTSPVLDGHDGGLPMPILRSLGSLSDGPRRPSTPGSGGKTTFSRTTETPSSGSTSPTTTPSDAGDTTPSSVEGVVSPASERSSSSSSSRTPPAPPLHPHRDPADIPNFLPLLQPHDEHWSYPTFLGSSEEEVRIQQHTRGVFVRKVNTKKSSAVLDIYTKGQHVRVKIHLYLAVARTPEKDEIVVQFTRKTGDSVLFNEVITQGRAFLLEKFGEGKKFTVEDLKRVLVPGEVADGVVEEETEDWAGRRLL